MNDTWKVRTGNPQRSGFARIEAEKYSVERGAQFSEGQTLRELHAQTEDDAAFLEHLNPALDDGTFHLEGGHPVHQESARHQG